MCQGQVRVILRGAGRKAQSRAQPPCCLSHTFTSAVFSWLIPSHPSERAECYRGSRNGAKTVGDQRGAAKMQLKRPGQAAPKGSWKGKWTQLSPLQVSCISSVAVRREMCEVKISGLIKKLGN